MFDTASGRFRFVGWFEGASFLLLLLVAMPLKYLADLPEMVSVVGMAHGILFMLYLLAAVHAAIEESWGLSRLGLALVASVLPFGPFLFDRYVLDKDEEASGEDRGSS